MTDPALREDFARDVVLLKYVGLNPIVVHGGGPGHHRLHAAARTCRSSSSAGCASATRTPSRSRRWCWSARSTRTSSCASTATGSRRSGSRATTGSCSASRRWRGPGGEDIGLVGRIERVDANVIHHIAEDYIPVIASVGADRLGPLAQRQRRRGRGRRRARHRRLQGHVPHGRRGLAARPGRPGARSSPSAAPTRSRPRWRSRRAGCGRSCRPASTRSTAASRSRTSSTAASRTRCCSSCSPTPASARRSGRRRERARPDLRALPGRVRVGLGLRARGLRRGRVPRLPGRDRGLLARARPPGASSPPCRSRRGG